MSCLLSYSVGIERNEISKTAKMSLAKQQYNSHRLLFVCFILRVGVCSRRFIQGFEMTTSTSLKIAKLYSARGFGTDVALGVKMATGDILACVHVLLIGRQSSSTIVLLL